MAFIQKPQAPETPAPQPRQTATSASRPTPRPSATAKAKVSRQSNTANRRTLARQQQMSENIAHIAAQLLENVQEGVTAIEQLKSAMDSVAAASEESAGAAEESLSAVNEITKNSAMIQRNAEQATAQVNGMLELSRMAQREVTTTANSIKTTIEDSSTLLEKAEQFQKASDGIGESVSLIGQVAEEINLLALNAAIEAARAKEDGKGFAVVASETRGLAALSSEQAERTHEIVSGVQGNVTALMQGINQVSDTLKSQVDSTETSIEVANQIGEHGDSIAQNIQNLNHTMALLVTEIEQLQKGSESIASAAQQQASAVSQANQTIEMQQTALLESEQAAASLDALAEELKNSTDLAKDAEEIASMAEQLSSAVEQIVGSMGQVVTALEQIEKASQLSTEDAEKNTEVARESLQHVNDAADALNQTFDELGETVEALNTLIQALASVRDNLQSGVKEGQQLNDTLQQTASQINRISMVLRAIDNVVIQTMMLSVSGSIEAARAGEKGKGFAVVSNDIRNLAQDAGANLEKIENTLMNLREESDYISRAWEAGLDDIGDNASQISNLVNDLTNLQKDLDGVVETVEDLKRAVEENAAALNQAQQGSEQIKEAAALSYNNVSESKTAAQLIQDSVQEVSIKVEELAVIADELQSHI